MFAFLSTHVWSYCHSGLWTEVRLVWSNWFTIMTVDVLLKKPVSLDLIDVNIDCWNLLASGVGVGLVSMRPIEDVGGWSLLALLRPFIIWLSSEVFTLLQSMQNCFYFETLWHWSLYRIVTTQPQARARATVDSNISILCPILTRLKILTGDSAPAPAPTCYIFGSN